MSGVTTYLSAFLGEAASPVPDFQNLQMAMLPKAFFTDTSGTTPAVNDGDAVAYWGDVSGNGNALRQDTSGSRPILKLNQLPNGGPCLRFDGTNDFYSLINPMILTDRTLYAIVKVPGSAVQTMLIGDDLSLDWRVDATVQRLVETNTADIGLGTTPITPATWTQVNVTWNFTDGVFRTGGLADSTVTLANSSYAATRYFGANVESGNEYFSTDIAAILVFSGIHNTATRQAVEAWLDDLINTTAPVSTSASPLQFHRLQNTPVLSKGSVYEGTWTADALAAPSFLWDGTQFAMTVSLWDSSKGHTEGFTGSWASAFFTSPDLINWSYVNGSLLIPATGKYIYGNAGYAWFGGKYWMATNIYGQYDDPTTIPVQVQWSTDQINWTIVNTAVLTGYADPALAVNPNNGRLELWTINAVTREINFSDSADGTNWVHHGVYLTSSPWNATNFGEPQPYWTGTGRFLTFDASTSDAKRFVGRSYSIASDNSWTTTGTVFGPNPFNSWESVQIFDACVAGPFNLGDGPYMYMLYAGSDIVAPTDNTNSSIGLARQAYAPTSNSTPPFSSDILAWWDNRSADISATSGSINTWTDRVNGNILTGTTTTRPKLVTASGINYIQFDSQYLDMPATFGWDMRNSSIFIAITRGAASVSTSSIWKMNTVHPIYDGLYMTGQRLHFFNQANNNDTSIYLSDNLACVSRVADGGIGVFIGAGNQYEGFSPNTAGTIANGGYLGEWEGPPLFPLTDAQVIGIVVYNKIVSNPSEYDAVMEWFSSYYRTTSPSSNRFLDMEGDSLTYGTGTSNRRLYNWPAQMMRMRDGSEVKYSNTAVAGTAVGDGNTPANNILTQLGLNLGLDKHVAIMLKGTNDLEANVSAATLETGYTNCVTRVHGEDPNTCIFVACTIFARNYTTPTADAQRLLFNTWLLGSGSGADYVVDLAADSRLSNYSDTTYFDPDGIHLNDNGYLVVASLIKAALDAHGLLD